ncbi:MAG TPA: YdbH domain-containing protein [Allosphingosinicella sp.]|jgi:hypothetical protein
MDAITEQEQVRPRRRLRMPLRRPRWALVLTGIVLLLALVVVIVWSSRLRIASDVIQRELDKRGVQASYRVTGIGLQKQRLEDVVLGDPANPDLTARWVEVEVALGWRQTRVSMIRARGVRLRGRIEDGKLRLGEVDKLLPPPSGRPFRLPNQRIDVADAEMRLATPAGRVGLAIQGSGNLAYSFDGRIAASAPRLASGSCRAERLRANFAVRTKEEEPSLDGPVSADRVRCGTTVLAGPQLALRTTLKPGLDEWNGEAGIRLAGFRSGDPGLRTVAGRVTFAGSAEQTRGAVDLAGAAASFGQFRATNLRLRGRYAVSPAKGSVSLLADASGAGIDASRAPALISAAGLLGSAGGTPVEPIGDALADAMRRAGRSFDAAGSLSFTRVARFQSLRVARIRLASRSGARLVLGGGQGFSYAWPAGRAQIDGNFALTGGGFPATRFSLRQRGPGVPLSGNARIAPMQAGGARLELAPLLFGAAPGGAIRIETRALISGPFNDGRVDGLALPIRGRFGAGGFAFGEQCTTVSFRSLQAAGLRLAATTLPLCPTGSALVSRKSGGALQAAAAVRSPRLSGRLGEAPISFAASSTRFDLSQPGFTSADVAIRLGRADAVQRLDLAALSGTFNRTGVTGRFSGGTGKIANVPLLLSAAAGDWSVRRGDLLIQGGMTVADEANPTRFFPLVTRDFRLSMIDNRIEAAGWLEDPDTGTRITRATIAHDLRAGRGNAVLDVPGIRFDPSYQPEQLTRLTTGVVALVNGIVTGQGRIAWSSAGTTSSGSFSTQKMDLAAPFGPVTGLTTTINFTDLLGLVTAPGQLAQVDRIQAGIDVFDGQVRYQLLPGQRVKVEAGRWPFAGGELALQETILDFSRESNKRLVFQVTGLDAARFVAQMEFSNISATGILDGTIPMEFDQTGGRIVGGRLVARPEGGTVSYIGELSDKQLGAYGKLAFDALKSLRYSKFTINLDGSLEGEFLAGIELDGVARNAPTPAGSGIAGAVVGRVLGQLAKIPFEFNIQVRGPFRALIATTRSFEDPSQLIQPVLPESLRDLPTSVTVQPEESETMK